MSKFLILSLLRQVLVITQSQVIAKELESQLILIIKTEDQDNE